MLAQFTAVLIAFIMASVNTISVIAKGQNETNEMDIVENQSVSGNISGFGVTRSYDPRTVDDPAMMIIPEQDRTLNETELKQELNGTKY
jgi:hypothetical protein